MLSVTAKTAGSGEASIRLWADIVAHVSKAMLGFWNDDGADRKKCGQAPAAAAGETF